MAFSSSSSIQQKQQVFLSFRGEDTRNNFTSHLHAALQRRGIDHFIDYQLKRGEEISPALLTAIEQSMISIIVLSKNYASSSWCLDELSKILECRERNEQMIVPIFYHVDPSDVRKQTGSFAEAFAEHVKKRADKVERWSAALVEVAGLAGHHLDAKKDRCESELIEGIVEDISKKLIYKFSNIFKGRLVGIDSRIKQIESLLCFNLVDIHILGIWGMGGIGKTTIAEAIYHQISTEFEGRYILTNVREKSQKYGWIHLRDELLRNILEERNLNIGTGLLPTFIHDRLHHKRVFIVLDDVDDSMQLDLLLEKHRFGPGSRIVLTSRDKQVLHHVVDEIYEVEGLNNNEALQLFSLYAFQQNRPKQDFMELSTEVVHYAKGLPLALKVVGSILYDRSKLDWEAYLNKLKKISDPNIDNMLRISYDGLDDEVKNIFLDIACFFKGNGRDYIENILDDCYNSVKFGISVLIDKSLITISHNSLEMHDLLQQMGWNIVLQDSKEPGKRSRLWDPKDSYHVLKNNTGTEKVEGMFLNMSKIKKVSLSSTTFVRMCNLKFLKFYFSDFESESERERKRKVYLSQQGLKSLPDNLSLLHWDDYPSKSLPLKFCPNNLVELTMPNSHIKRLWNGVQNLIKLKRLDLSGSRHLIKIPDLSRATDLESINLDGCKSLVEVPSSIECLSNLKYLHLKDCRRIERLPSICKLEFLRSLNLSGCFKLKSFPDILKTMECLTDLDLSHTSIEELPSSIEHLIRLKDLNLDYCEKLKDLPSSIGKLKSLYIISLCHCSNITKFPGIPKNLWSLDLSGTAIEQVPSSIESFSKLQLLYLENCTKLGSLPRNIFQSKSLIDLRVSGFSKLEIIQELLGNVQALITNGTTQISKDKFLRRLDVSSCSGLDELLDELLDNIDFKFLRLSDCNLFTLPSRLTCITSITELNLSRNKFETIHASINQLLELKKLDLSYCERLRLLPASIKQLLKLERLDLSYCKRLQFLPELPANIQYLDARDCISLEAVSSSFTIRSMSCDFIFLNCINMDQNTIWAKTQLVITEIELYLKVHKNQFIETSSSICLPGSEIPKWFNCQNQGSSVTIQWPPHLHRHTCLGFALCAVLAFNDNPNYICNGGKVQVECQINFTPNGGDSHEISDFISLWENSNRFRIIGSDHVFVNYYRHYFGGLGLHLNEVSFEFSSNFGVVKKCGVCLLFDPTWLSLKSGVISQDYVELMVDNGTATMRCNPLLLQPSSPYDPTWLSLKCGIISQDFVEPMVEDNTTTKRPRDEYCYDQAELSENLSSDEEEDPRPKRLKYMEFF